MYIGGVEDEKRAPETAVEASITVLEANASSNNNNNNNNNNRF